MNDILRLFQAFVAPAIFVSAEALLLLSLNARLMGIVSRLRAYLQKRHMAMKAGQIAQSDAYASQIVSIEQRAEMIRKAFIWTLCSLTGTIASCLLLGLGLYWQRTQTIAAVLFVVATVGLMTGVLYYIREVSLALTSVHDEAADFRFMDVEGRSAAGETRMSPSTYDVYDV